MTQPNTTNRLAYFALAATSLLWGTTWVAMKFGVSTLPPLELATIRQFIGGSLFLGFFLLKGASIPSKKQLSQLFVLSLFTFVFANGLSTWSLQYISSGLAALIGALYPLCVVLIEHFYFKSKQLNLLSLVGIVLGIAGITVVFYENAFAKHPEGYAFGICLALIAMLSWSISTIMISRQTVKINPYFGMGWQMFFSSFMIFGLSFIPGGHVPIQDIPLVSWAVIAYLIGAGSIFAIIAFIYTMKHLHPGVAALYAYINPIVAIVIGSILLDEHISLQLIIGSLITLFGVYLVNRNLKKS